RWTPLAAAAGIPNGDISSLISLHVLISRINTTRSVVTYSLLEALPSNPAKMIFGRIFRHGELMSMSQPSPTLRILSPEFVTRTPPSEYTDPKPPRSPTRTTSSLDTVGPISWHQKQRWNGRVEGVAISCYFRQEIQQLNQCILGNLGRNFDGEDILEKERYGASRTTDDLDCEPIWHDAKNASEANGDR